MGAPHVRLLGVSGGLELEGVSGWVQAEEVWVHVPHVGLGGKWRLSWS